MSGSPRSLATPDTKYLDKLDELISELIKAPNFSRFTGDYIIQNFGSRY